MNVLQSLVFDEVCHRRALRRSDVAAVRALYEANETVCQTEIAALLTINQACFVQDPSWGDFLVEALTDFVVSEMEPAGSVTDDNAAWLISAIAPSGTLMSHRLRECVVAIMASAAPAPVRLRAFLISCLRADLTSRTGAAISLMSRNPAAVDRAILDLAEAIFGGISACGLRLTRPELDDLRAINATRAVAASEVWPRFLAALTSLSLLELADYALPDLESVVAHIHEAADPPWQAASILALDAEGVKLRSLERQRTAIVHGVAAKPATVTDFAAVLGGTAGYETARRALVGAGYAIQAATGSRAVDAA
jgi:hypothetical protein